MVIHSIAKYVNFASRVVQIQQESKVKYEFIPDRHLPAQS